jgi:hypothetical protein
MLTASVAAEARFDLGDQHLLGNESTSTETVGGLLSGRLVAACKV